MAETPIAGPPDGVAVFRPPWSLRAALALFGAVCAWAAAWQLWRFAASWDARRLAAAAVVSVPCALAAAVLRRRVEVHPEGLRSTTLLRARAIPWEAVRRVDQGRASFVIQTDAGPVSAGWLAPSARDRLLRLILQRARLLARAGRLRWGLRAQYVRRQPPGAAKKP